MKAQRLYQVLREPHVTEKTVNVGDAGNQYVFKVAVDATKAEIREAVSRIYDVDVLNVTTLNVKGKRKRRFGRREHFRTNHWKKAYVRLSEGQNIDFTKEAN